MILKVLQCVYKIQKQSEVNIMIRRENLSSIENVCDKYKKLTEEQKLYIAGIMEGILIKTEVTKVG